MKGGEAVIRIPVLSIEFPLAEVYEEFPMPDDVAEPQSNGGAPSPPSA
jgi:hypothetical protein